MSDKTHSQLSAYRSLEHSFKFSPTTIILYFHPTLATPSARKTYLELCEGKVGSAEAGDLLPRVQLAQVGRSGQPMLVVGCCARLCSFLSISFHDK